MATSCARCCSTSVPGATARRKVRISHADLLLHRFSLYCPDSGRWSWPVPVFLAPLYLLQSFLAAFGKSTFVLGIRVLALWHHPDPGRTCVALVISAGGSGNNQGNTCAARIRVM